jgi:hypothetical protein
MEYVIRPGVVVIVDDDMEPVMRSREWFVNNGYVRTGKQAFLTWWAIGKAPFGMEVDHINRNRLDNRRGNLRFVTPTENKWNMSLRCNNVTGVEGVNWHKQSRKWLVQIRMGGRRHTLGVYQDFFEACCARKSAGNRRVVKHGVNL